MALAARPRWRNWPEPKLPGSRPFPAWTLAEGLPRKSPFRRPYKQRALPLSCVRCSGSIWTRERPPVLRLTSMAPAGKGAQALRNPIIPASRDLEKPEEGTQAPKQRRLPPDFSNTIPSPWDRPAEPVKPEWKASGVSLLPTSRQSAPYLLPELQRRVTKQIRARAIGQRAEETVRRAALLLAVPRSELRLWRAARLTNSPRQRRRELTAPQMQPSHAWRAADRGQWSTYL